MDVLYTGDIPKSFCYAVFGSDYVTLYDRPSAQNITLPFYRIYFNTPGFFYSQGTSNFTNYNSQTFQKVEVSDKWYHRDDSLTILSFTVCVCVATLWFVNLFTSIFKKGGLLSGLF